MKKLYQFFKIDDNAELPNNVLSICWGKERFMLNMFSDSKTHEEAYNQFKKACEQAAQDGVVPASVGVWLEYDAEFSFSEADALEIEKCGDCYHLFWQCPYEWLNQ